MFTLNCKGRLITMETPLVMGIINITPDSFYVSSRHTGIDEVLQKAEQMLSEGATFIDIGGQSTRPGSELLSAEVELLRIIPLIESIARQFPEANISVDTFHSRVAAEAVAAGASMVNDVSGGQMDNDMLTTVGKLKVPYVCMHMQGTPQNMHQNPSYKDIALEVLDYFIGKIADCKMAGIYDVIIDPGFGFGKTIQHNFQLLKQLPVFSILEKPLLAGLSRKSTIYKTLGVSVEEALNGTTVLNSMALQNGARILRVHDVKEAVEAAKLFSAYWQA